MIGKTIKLTDKQLDRLDVAIRLYNKRSGRKVTRHWFMKMAVLDLVSVYVKE